MLSVVRQRPLPGERFKYSPPGQFAGLIATKTDAKQSGLNRQKQNLQVLVGAEDLLYDARMGHHVQAVFGFIGLPHTPAVREVILKLHQHDWRTVPHETKEQCRTAF